MSAPWIDLHAHPGQFFLDGLPPDDPALALRQLGDGDAPATDVGEASMTAVAFATIGDMRALALDPAGGLVGRGDVDDTILYPDHLRQLDAAIAAATRADFGILRSGADLDTAIASARTYMWIACEGADFVGSDYDRLGEAYDRGARSIQVMHYRPNAYGDGQTVPPVHGGLSAPGREVIREANRLGMVVDLAHASVETTRDAARISTAPIMVSHTHLAGTGRDHPRMISPEHARIVADSGGVIGAWPSGFSSRSFDDFVREIDRLATVVGADHVGIGTDMDGNYRPVMTSYAQFRDLPGALASRGYPKDDIDAILGGNAARLIRAVCP